jgi:hypothetical protein
MQTTRGHTKEKKLTEQQLVQEELRKASSKTTEHNTMHRK